MTVKNNDVHHFISTLIGLCNAKLLKGQLHTPTFCCMLEKMFDRNQTILPKNVEQTSANMNLRPSITPLVFGSFSIDLQLPYNK